MTEAPKVIITEDIRPETLLKFEDYKRDFKLRWDIHLYEWNALLVDLRKAYDFSKPFCNVYFGRQPNEEIIEQSKGLLGVPFGFVLSQYIEPL